MLHKLRILLVFLIINQFNVNTQSTINVSSSGQILNLTLLPTLSYTLQSPITTNQTTSLLLSSKPNTTNTMMTTVSILTNHTISSFSTAANRTRPLFMMNSTRRTSITPTIIVSTSGHGHYTTSHNSASNSEQYITLLNLIHFLLLLIFPIL